MSAMTIAATATVGIILIVTMTYRLLTLSRENKIKSAMITELKVEEILSNIIETTCVDRALLCKIHNGGKEIKVGSKKHISVLVEPSNSLQPSVKNDYQNFSLDVEYIKLLIDMLEDRQRFAYRETNKLPPSALERKLKADNITASIHVNCAASDTALYCLLFGTTGEPSALLGRYKDYSKLETYVHKIKNLVKSAIKKNIIK